MAIEKPIIYFITVVPNDSHCQLKVWIIGLHNKSPLIYNVIKLITIFGRKYFAEHGEDITSRDASAYWDAIKIWPDPS
jgi:hypothetical protein